MVPPKPSTNDLSFLDWAPGQDSLPANPGTDPSNCKTCHTTPKPGQDISPVGGNPFFIDYAKKPNGPLTSQQAADLRTWLADAKRSTSTLSPVPAKTPAVKPVAPGNAAKLEDHAKELERQARLCMDPEKKLACYQSALTFRLLAGDAKGSTAALDELEAGYKKTKHVAGEKFVAATRLWVGGKTDEALKALMEMESAAQHSGWTFNQHYASQRSLMLQMIAGEKLREKDYAGAKPLLLEALRVSPSDQLTSKVLKLMAENGGANLKGQAAAIESLQEQRDKLATPPVQCNSGCHKGPDLKADLNDFSNFEPLLKDELGHPLLQGPDLGKYRNLKHLSYQEKVRLRDLDQQIVDAKAKLNQCQDEVRVLLFTKTLDDPKANIADLEESMLKGASAFSGPDRSLPWYLAGEAYLAKKDYAKAVAALEAAVQEDPTLTDAQFSLGNARFAAGDFKGSRDAYTAILERRPREISALRYRADANSHYLASLDPKVYAEEITKVEQEIASDHALLLASSSRQEKTKLADMEKLLAGLHDGDSDKARAIAGLAGLKPEEIGGITKKDLIAAIEGLAQNYLNLAEQSFADPKDSEWVRSELNGLAAECFAVLERFATADKDPEIQRMAKVYEGYGLIANGKIDEGVAILEPLRKIPQADRILKGIEKGKMRLVNLGAVETWAYFNQEMEQVETDSAKGWMSRTSVAGVSAKWAKEKAIQQAVKEKLLSGDADSMEAALKLIAKTGSEKLKERAKYYLSTESRANGTGPIGDLVAYASGQPPADTDAQRILAKSFDNEVKGAVNSSLAFYALIESASPEEDLKKKAKANMDSLQGKATFGRSVEKFFKMHSGEGLAVDIGIMFVAAGLGNLAKLRMLAKLEQAGVNGYKAVAIASAVGIGTEATLFWGGSTIKEAMLTDPSKVFTKEHLLKSYGSSLLMIGGLKGFGKLAEGLGPRAAKSLGLVTEGGAGLTKGGKVLVWGIGHSGGLLGMIASSKANQGLGLTEMPRGGWKEGLVHDVFGYVQFAIAHKVADGAFGGKLSALSTKQHSEIAVREAILSAKSYADAMGYRATRNAKGEIVETPERKILVGLLVDASLNKVGFTGSKLAKLVESKKFGQANEYFAEFGLPLEYNKSGQLTAATPGGASPHEAAGFPPGKIKPSPKLKESAAKALDTVNNWIWGGYPTIFDKAFQWMFGPPGGGMGPLIPAPAGAYGAAKVYAKPKDTKQGPNVLLKLNDVEWNNGLHPSLEKFETKLVEKDIGDVTHNSKGDKNPDAVKVGLEKAQGLKEVAEALKNDMPEGLKTLHVTVEEGVILSELAGLVKAARDKGVDLFIYDKTSPDKPAYQYVGKRFLVPDEAAAKELMGQAIKSGQDVEIAFSKDGKTRAKVSGDKVVVDFKMHVKSEQVELLEQILSFAVQGKKNLTLEIAGGESFTLTHADGRINVKGSGGEILNYAPGAMGKRGLVEIILPKTANPDSAAILLRAAAELKPEQLQGSRVFVGGLDLSLGGPVKSNLSQLIQKSLWGQASKVEIGTGGEIVIEAPGKGSSLSYNFQTKLPFDQGSHYLAEYLAFEGAKALGATGPADAKSALMLKYYRTGARQVAELHKHAGSLPDALNRATKQAEFGYFVNGKGDYATYWLLGAEKMAEFAKTPKQQQQLNDVLAKMRDYSQTQEGEFLGFKAFDGRSFADNAFELNRILGGAKIDPKIDLPTVLGDVAKLFGTNGKVQVYGAGVGMVYKMSVLRDNAAKNEFDRFQTMHKEAVASGEAFRFSIIPEDRFQGSNRGTAAFTKTPEWVVEKLDASGKPVKMLTVEVTGKDGEKAQAHEPGSRKGVNDTIADKVFQVTGHEFGKATNQGDSLIVIRFSKSAKREAELVKLVQDALALEYRTNGSKMKAKEKIRVMVILEDVSGGGSRTKWLEYDKSGAWKERPAGGKTEATGSAWSEPFYQAIGW